MCVPSRDGGLYKTPMTSKADWWRSFCGLMVAMLLSVLVSVPVLDNVICGADGVSAAASTQSSPAVDGHGAAFVAASDHGGALQAATDEGDACAHGHCHHASPCTPDLAVEPEVCFGPSERLPVLQVASLPSNAPDGLERPPRA